MATETYTEKYIKERELKEKNEAQRYLIIFLIIIVIILIYTTRQASNSGQTYRDENSPTCYQTERGMECDQ
jgi:hypothetical protein